MSQRDGFTSGFLAGALVGGLVGGLVGALVASRQKAEPEEEGAFLDASESSNVEASSIEGARRSLDAKIAQLNSAIDDVRQQLGSVNGNATEFEGEYRDR
jgi:hypothetical protein